MQAINLDHITHSDSLSLSLISSGSDWDEVSDSLHTGQKKNSTREKQTSHICTSRLFTFIISSLKQEEHKEEHQKRRSRLTRNILCISVGTFSRTGHFFDYSLSVRSSSASLSHSLVGGGLLKINRPVSSQVSKQWRRRRRMRRRWDAE